MSSLLDQAARKEPDYAVFPELSTTQFWCVGLKNGKFFGWAEPLPGPTAKLFGQKAKEHCFHIILPIFEKGRVEGEYFNSAVVINPDGDLLAGVMSDGSESIPTRKNYISDYAWEHGQNDEKFYFRQGEGHPIYPTKKARIGILICYDRWFVEAWRCMALNGAEIVFVPSGSAGYVKEMFVCLLKACAAQNIVYVAACNKSGIESVNGKKTNYFGLSCLIAPDGQVLGKSSKNSPEIVTADMDLDLIGKVRQTLCIYRDRRTSLYKRLIEQ